MNFEYYHVVLYAVINRYAYHMGSNSHTNGRSGLCTFAFIS